MAEIEVKRIGRARVSVRVEGTAPLIMHKFSEKARRQMLDNMQGRKSPKEVKDPEKEYEASLYHLPGNRYGVPAVAFKAATIGGARMFGKNVTMVSLKPIIFIEGETREMLVPIEGHPEMREDYARVGVNGTDLRYRGEFWPWAATLNVIYVPSMLSLDSLLALIDAGGMGGVGDWRPSAKSNSGIFGTYTLAENQDIQEVKQ